MANERERLAIVETIVTDMRGKQSEICHDIKCILKHVAIAETKDAQRLKDDRKTIAKSMAGGAGSGGIIAGIITAIAELLSKQ